MRPLVLLGVALACFARAQDPASRPTQVPVETGVSQPVADTTETFFPQINRSVFQRAIRPENPKMPRPIPVSEFVPEERIVANDTRATFGKYFPGVSYNGSNPPDPHLACGPAHLIQVVNTEIAFYTKAGVKVFQQSLDNVGFFKGVAQTDFVFDPRVIYDFHSKRFFVVAIEYRDSPQNSGLLIAVSDSSNPTGGWTKYRVNTRVVRNGSPYWMDYPTVGHNKDGLVITGNFFQFSGNDSFARSYVFPKAPFLAGQTVSYSIFVHDDVYTIQAARTLENTTARIFGAALYSTSRMAVLAWSNVGTSSPKMDQTLVTIPSYVTFTGKLPTRTGSLIDPVADRLMDAAVRGNTLLCAHTVKVSANDNRTMVRWYEFSPDQWPASGTVRRRQSGNVTLSAPNSLCVPAIVKNGKNAISIVLTRTSGSVNPDLYYCSRKDTDPLNSMGPLQRFGVSARGPRNPDSRWGDYFSVTVDPGAAARFWGTGQTVDANGDWTTAIAYWDL
ncbi:MAG: hypothetical protein KIT11_04795 [Fimbriimonadaceae bacterium]|nr:hypothetical protein [Fimbriimonadaceae bacterium]QYK56788.1 MAG: hypothetical protein KF733_04725 [Fimbriimonadaceae bacterium]